MAFESSSFLRLPIFCENFEIAAVQKCANLVELEKCCRTHIFLQKFNEPSKNLQILQEVIIFPIFTLRNIALLRVQPNLGRSPLSSRWVPSSSLMIRPTVFPTEMAAFWNAFVFLTSIQTFGIFFKKICKL